MSLSRSPSPRPEGGWSSPGLQSSSGSSTPGSGLLTPSSGVSWAAAKAKSDEVRGYPSSSQRNGFCSRSTRRIYSSLPRFSTEETGDYTDKDETDELEQGKKYSYGPGRGLFAFPRTLVRRTRLRTLLGSMLAFVAFFFFCSSLNEHHRRSSSASGHKVVVMLASNVEGGVMEVKGAREWEIERISIQNKELYTKRWGYGFETVNMMTQRRYSQEWREGWEKVDLIRETMRKYPDAEWFWWLDLNTWIMEPSYSLQDHLFSQLDPISYRDVNAYTSLEHGPPPANTYFDKVVLAPNGDRDTSSIDLILSQDCGGLNLGSFLIRRSTWTDRLLDIWWDPVLYEENYMEWQHKEQDALGYLYDHHPWIRARVAFVPQRYINSFPPGACGDSIDPAIHYKEEDRDFVVNMANCQSGRDCLGEMDQFRESSHRLNGVVQKRCMDKVKQFFRKMFGVKEQPRQA